MRPFLVVEGASTLIVFWNRYEVWFGTDIEKFKNARDILIDNNIKYRFRVTARRARGHVIRTHYLYVHKKDAKEAMFLLR